MTEEVGGDLRSPSVQFTIIIAYGAAAIAKLKYGFFDTATSCAGPRYGLSTGESVLLETDA